MSGSLPLEHQRLLRTYMLMKERFQHIAILYYIVIPTVQTVKEALKIALADPEA